VESLASKDKLSKTIYSLQNSDEEAIAEAEIENAQIAAQAEFQLIEGLTDLTAEEFANAMLEEE